MIESMEHFLGPILLFGILAVLAAILKSRSRPARNEDRYEQRNVLFTPAERSFLGVLEQAVLEEYRIFGKVRLGDLIRPARGMGRKQSTGARNRVNQKHVDFVLCRPDTLEIAGVVELDDSSHGRRQRAERDRFVDGALSSAGITIVRFPARKGYAVLEVKAKLVGEGLLNSSEGQGVNSEKAAIAEAVGVTAGRTADSVDGPSEKPAHPPAVSHSPKEPPAPVCPSCDSPMVKRQAKKGKYAGRWFWACSGYPKCRKIVAVGS